MKILPSMSLLMISALVIFSPLQEGGTTHPAQMIIRLLILAWLGIVLATGIRAGRLAVPVLAMRYVVLAFVGLALVATLFSPYAHSSRQWLIMIMGYVTIFYLLVSCVDRWEHVRTLTVMIALMGIGEAGWAIVQGLAWNVLRPGGTFFNPNFLAGYLTVTWTILLSVAIYGYRPVSTGSRPWMSPVLWWLGLGTALGGLFLAILLTQSRGGMIVCLVGTVFVLTARYGWKLAGSCVAAVVLLGLVVPTPIRDRVLAEHQQNPVSYARWQMWQGAVAQMVDHPLGIGLGLYQYTYPQYAFPVDGEIARFGKVAQTPHNDYLQLGVEMGPGAILVFGSGVVLLFRELRHVLHARLRRWQRSLIVGVGGGGIALLVHAALDSSLRESALAILLVLCGAVIVSAARLTRRGTDAVYVVPIHSRWAWGIGAACLVLVAGAEVTRMGVAWIKFERASRQAMAGETVAAIEGLKAAVALDPGKALYHHGLGSVYARAFESSREKQVFQLAYAEFKQAIELNPLDSRLLGLLGQLYVSAARFKDTEATLTFAAGYLANISAVPALIGKDGLILADRLCHASLIDGCRLSGATFRIYHHRDMNHLEQLLGRRPPGKPTLIVTDGIFSMDGDIAPMRDIALLAEQYGAAVYVDDAHGTGILGETGRGTLEHCDVETRIPYHMGTLSKAIGSSGGYLAGSAEFVAYLVNTCRAFTYTTAPTPAAAAAATAALRVIRREPERRARLWRNRHRLAQGLSGLGFLLAASESPILPVIVGDPDRAMNLAHTLLTLGVYAPAIRPPTVPASTSRIRFTITADHTDEHIDQALTALAQAGRTLNMI